MKGKEAARSASMEIAERPPSHKDRETQLATDRKASKVLGAYVVPDRSPVVPTSPEGSSYDFPRDPQSMDHDPEDWPLPAVESTGLSLDDLTLPAGYSYFENSYGDLELRRHQDRESSFAFTLADEEDIGIASTTDGPVISTDEAYDRFAPPSMAPEPALRMGAPNVSEADKLRLLRSSLSRLWILKAMCAEMHKEALNGLIRDGLMSEGQAQALGDMDRVCVDVINNINASWMCRAISNSMRKAGGDGLSRVVVKEAQKVSKEADRKCDDFVHQYEGTGPRM